MQRLRGAVQVFECAEEMNLGGGSFAAATPRLLKTDRRTTQMTIVAPRVFHPAKAGAPNALAPSEADLFRTIIRDYRIHDEVSLRIIEEGLLSLQRAREAREQIDKDGLTFVDKHGQPRVHPLLAVERDARAAALAAFRQL